jgi:hypothetical protein
MTLKEIPATTTARRVAVAALALLSGLAFAPASLAAAAGAKLAARAPALANGHALWATIDVCGSEPSPMVGIRGSMPSDGQPHETMYMLFKVQYLDTKTKQWTDLPKGGHSSGVKVGTASTTRQAGWTFELAAPPHGSTFQLRGVVEFQWRQGSKVTLSTSRPTSGGHPSAAGAVPRGFSAATCTIN